MQAPDLTRFDAAACPSPLGAVCNTEQALCLNRMHLQKYGIRHIPVHVRKEIRKT